MRKILMKRSLCFLLVLTLLIPMICFKSNIKAASNDILTNLNTDKSMYTPGDTVTIYMDLKNDTGANIVGGSVKLSFSHLAQTVSNNAIINYDLQSGASTTLSYQWKPPVTDFQGYLVTAECYNQAGSLLNKDTVGVDVSSVWTKFPRYGYVWNFGQNVDTSSRIWKLKNYHINALQYYDWQYRHHKPLSDNTEIWNDWSGRLIYGDTIRSYITNAKSMNIVNMEYNMIYGGTNSFAQDGVNPSWQLYHAEEKGDGHHLGDPFKFYMADTPTGQNTLFFFNPASLDWQSYIFAQENNAISTMGFDGWHGDTVGEWGKMWAANDVGDASKAFYVKDTYTYFLNNAKKAIGNKYMVFNPVGAQGIENVNRSNVDVLYTEFWPWDRDSEGNLYDNYNAIKNEIIQSRKESGGKSLIVPAYMNYTYGKNNPGSNFNMASVLLTDATVYAAGGSRMELGDNGNMLCNEYFPAQNLNMTADHDKREHDLYDFIVAYENLLRDGQTETSNRIEFTNYQSSSNGETQKIWAYGKKDNKYEIIQMINLLGVSTNDWRADNGSKDTPTKVQNVEVKYYYSGTVNSVVVTSPDPAYDGISIPVNYTKGSDSNGNYVKFVMPSLEYWNMVYMSADTVPGSNLTDDLTTGNTELTNGGFEAGNLSGWNVNGNSAGVDGSDVAEGNYKCYFWGTTSYTQKIDQTIIGLENGNYQVTARVKQNTGSPTTSRMELSGTGSNTVYVSIPHGSSYSQISGIANVVNNKINIAFYQAAGANTNLQIDNVTLTKVTNPETPTPTPTVTVTPTPGLIRHDIPGQIEAEDYDSMSGIQVENCGEGGQDVGHIDTGDWMEYPITVTNAGTYTFEARVSSINTTGKFDLLLDGNLLATISVPNTGAWQTYTTVSTQLNLTSGEHTLRIGCRSMNYNMNWIKFTTDNPTITPTTTPTVTPTPTPTVPPTGLSFVNPGFETGNINGWTEWHPTGQAAMYGVDGSDVKSGNKKLWFWSSSGYQQSIHQLIGNLENGSYTVKAWIKQSSGSPSVCRMEVSGYGDSTKYVNCSNGSEYIQYSATVNVTNGKLDIGFYINSSSGNANMQIDDVEIIRN